MKILQVITLSDLGGAQSVVIELSNALVKKGHEVVVVSKDDGYMWKLLDEKIRKVKCHTLCREVNPIKDFSSFFFLRKIIKEEKPDAIHLHSSKAGVLGRLAAFPFYTHKTFYTVHGFDTILKANKMFLPIEKFLKNFCSQIIAVSAYDLENLRKQNIHNTSVIYNAVALNNTHKKNNKIIEQIESLKKNTKCILTVSRDAKPKRIDLFQDIAKELPELCFVWIGNKEAVSNPPPNAFFLGEIPNASSYISQADIFILLSDYEGLPMSVIESLANGIPVIASNVGGIPEILNDEAGFALENNAITFKEKICYLLKNKEICTKIRHNALARYNSDFTIDIMAKAYENLYTNSFVPEEK